jgi:transaldolase
MTAKNPLVRLHEYGQSIWLDLLSRNLIRSGALQKLIETDAVTGVTSNPAIFEKAIGHSADYDNDIRKLSEAGKSAAQIYQEIAIGDIQEAAGLLHPVFLRTNGDDGYVSLEVSPLLAHDTAATINEAHQLWQTVDRPNVMIKIPSTREGLPAITECIAGGINVNITLLFGLPRYREVANAFIQGVEERARRGADIHGVRSVASFFLSRIDTLIDHELDERSRSNAAFMETARGIRGEVAIASARLAYQIYKEVFSSKRFQALERKGARKQWLLWGSTSTKAKEYSDVKYVEALIGPETVNTMPLETVDAYRDHGSPEPRLERDLDRAREVMARLASAGMDIDAITQKLEDDGVEKFVQPFGNLMQELDRKTRSLQAV